MDSIKKFMGQAHQILIDAGIPDEAITIKIHEREMGIARDTIVESDHRLQVVYG